MTGDTDSGIVLLSCVEPIGELLVNGDPIEFSGGLVVLFGPGLSAVEADSSPAVIALNHNIRIMGVDPQSVVIAMGYSNRGVEIFSAIYGLVKADITGIEGVLISGVGSKVRVVPATLAQFMIPIDTRPGLATIIRTVEAAFFFFCCLNNRPNAVGVGRRDGQANSAE